MLYTPFKNLCLSVHPSVSTSFLLSIWCIFLLIFFKLIKKLILGRSVFGLLMGKFHQISTELWPLIDVRNTFRSLPLAFFLPIFFKFA